MGRSWFDRLESRIEYSGNSLKLSLRDFNIGSCQGEVEATVDATGSITLRGECEFMPDIIRSITGCNCSNLRNNLQRYMMQATQAAVYFGASKIRRSFRELYTYSCEQKAATFWTAIVEHHQTFAGSFDTMSVSARHELLQKIDLLHLIGLYEYANDGNRDLQIHARRQLLQSFSDVLDEVVNSLLIKIQDESELFQDIHAIALNGVGKEVDEAFKALHRLAQNCELKLEQLECLLRMKGAQSRLVAGRWDVARKLMASYDNLGEIPKPTLCLISDALLAAPNRDIGIEHQYQILHATRSTSTRAYISENIMRLRS
jgi:hypothetical protein